MDITIGKTLLMHLISGPWWDQTSSSLNRPCDRPIYFENEQDSAFPSNSHKKHGCSVGFAEDIGDHLTQKILTEDTHVIIWSAMRSALHTSPNQRLSPPSRGGSSR